MISKCASSPIAIPTCTSPCSPICPTPSREPRDKDTHPLVELAIRLIDELNEKYAIAQRLARFLLLHRHRIFNARQGVWMGWERKRGKLLDLNKLLTGEFDAFPDQGRATSRRSREVRYVLTLDSDTQLPRGTAARHDRRHGASAQSGHHRSRSFAS